MRTVDFIIQLMIILIPFSMAIAPAPMNVFSGMLMAAFLVKKVVSRKAPFVPTPVNASFLLFFLASSLSFFNTVDFDHSLHGLLRLIHYLVVFLIIAEELKESKFVKAVFFSLMAGAALVSADALWQVVLGKDFMRGNAPILNIGLNRATASFPDANVLGIYLSAIVPLIATLGLYHFRGRKKAAVLFICLLTITGLMLTYSRPTIMALYISLLLLGMIKKDKRLTLFLLVLALLSPLLAPKSVKDWSKQVDYNFTRFMCNDDRIAIYHNSLNMIKAHPVLGVGVNTFMENYRKYKQNPEYRNVVTSDYIYAHNNFLHMAGEVGFLGLVMFLFFLYKLFQANIRTYKKLSGLHLKNILLGLTLCLIAFLINGLTESSLYYSRVVTIFWYLVGCSLAMRNFLPDTRLQNVQKILVFRNDRFGEFLLNIPALRALNDTFSEAKMTLVIDPQVGEFNGYIPFAQETIEWKGNRHTLWQRLELIQLLKKKKFDLAVMLNPSREFNLITYFSGIPVRAGYRRKWDFLLTHTLKDNKHLGLKHEVEYNLELVGLVGATTPNKLISFHLEHDYIREVASKFGFKEGLDMILLHPWSSDPVKEWPKENFIQLARRLAKEPGVQLAVVGGKNEAAKSMDFCQQIGDHRVFDFTGKTDLKQLTALIRSARLVISGDSGPAHLTACTSTYLIVLFSSSVPGKSARRWGPWNRSDAVIEKPSLSEITVDEVFAKAKGMLRR